MPLLNKVSRETAVNGSGDAIRPSLLPHDAQNGSVNPALSASGRAAINMCCLLAMALCDMKAAEKSDEVQARLTVDRIFSAKEFESQHIGLVVWSRRSGSYFTVSEISTPNDPSDSRRWDIVRVDVVSGKRETVIAAKDLMAPGHGKALAIDGIQLSHDESTLLIYSNSQRVWRQKTRGDYWSITVATKELKKLGGDATAATLMFAKFSPDGSRVSYVHGNNLYVQDLRDLRIHQLTSDGSATIINGTADWVNEEELGIRDGYRWCPDGQTIAFWQFDTTGVPEFSLIDNTAGLYPRVITFAYPKVGQVNSATRIGLVNASGGTVRWLAVPGDSRQHYLPEMEWSPDGKRIMLQQLNRLQNTNLVMLADAQTGTTSTVLAETDAAWVESDNLVRWVNGGQQFLWLSDRDGWRHVYVANSDGGACTLLTPGDFDVLEIETIDEVNGWVYYSASPDHPTQRYLFRVRLSGGNPERLSPAHQQGWHAYQMSPDATWAIHTYSTFISPPVVELISLADHRVIRVLADNADLRKKVAALSQPTAEFFRVDIGDGLSFDAWALFPPRLDPARKYPLIFHVYGEPAGQTVCDKWGGPRELWHWLLAQRGCIVASVDTRGTKVPRGREFRKSVFHKIGITAPADLAASAQALLKRWTFADPARVGVWGWSGGGSNTLHAIFRYPDLFGTAIAVAPNADQLLYDTIYQERYMGLPDDNAEGYRLGSPITFADKLRGNLLLVHGTGDDNGHYQGTEALINKLIAHHKKFTVMPYPARSHALAEGEQTVPHFYTLMTDYFAMHLAPKP